MDIDVKRVYDAPSRGDGERILVDRVWPRGMRKADARLDQWLKEIAPSSALRKWFGHDESKWEEFKRRYFQELDEKSDVVAGLLQRAGKARLTLLFGARDREHNNAVALAHYLKAVHRH
ncbi:MAG: DUF488 domain-containing protein [Gammaproteobacteria bacterium]